MCAGNQPVETGSVVSRAEKRLKGDRRGGQDGRSWSLTVEAPRPIEKSPAALAPENSNMSASGWV